MVKVDALVVPLNKGQTAISIARCLRLVNHTLRTSSSEENLYIPLLRQIDESESKRLSAILGPPKIEEREFNERPRVPRTLAEALQNRLPPHLLANVPKAFDILGHIAIVEVPDELVPFDKTIGRAVLETCPNVRTVMAKSGFFSSDYRVRALRLIGGEDQSVTHYRENGCVFELDVKAVFFSPRLSHERLRVASQVQPGEAVVDMFAGVGPYSILIAKRQPRSTVCAIDANPSAFRFLVTNILANRVVARVRPILGDAQEVVRSGLSGKADRVIMNLPGSAADFVGVACESLAERGGVIHFYSFESGQDPQEAGSRRLKERVQASGRSVDSILATRIVKEVAPRRFQVAVDARIS